MEYRTRAQWGATFDPSGIDHIPLPSDRLFIHHNVMEPSNDPNRDMRNTEAVDINRFGTPSYKYAIHPSGIVLEGMTTHWSPDTYMFNDRLSIMFMGNFEVDAPTTNALLACRELIQTLKAQGIFAQNGMILGHRDVYATACPGANLYPLIGQLGIPPAPPAPKPPTPAPVVRKDDNMVLTDPTTNGVWVVDNTGAVFAYDGAPYLGGCNNNKYDPMHFGCVGITRYSDSSGEGYCLVLDFGPPPGNTGDRYRRYRFPRNGSAKV
jgi:N-acetylmuramoyl-L-alanine amidase